MTYQFTASPDFPPKLLSGWFFLNTWLQHKLNDGVHFEPYDNFKSQHEAIAQNNIDIIYANPFDAAMLMRDKGFIPLVKPDQKSDEAVIVVLKDSPIKSIDDIGKTDQIACTLDPDVYMISQIMLEAAEIDQGKLTTNTCDTYIQVVKSLLNKQSQLGFFLQEAYDDLSSIAKSQLRVLMVSDIQVIHHVLMISPALVNKQQHLSKSLIEMKNIAKDQTILDALEIKGFVEMEQEEAEMMIDLMDTLNDYPLP